MIEIQKILKTAQTYANKMLFATLLLSIFLIGAFTCEAIGAESFYPYITDTLPISGDVKKLVIPKQTPNFLFALVGYDGNAKPSDKAGLYIFDVSETANIKQISYLPVVSPIGIELSPDGQTLFLYAGQEPEGLSGVSMLDISTPDAIRQVGGLDIDILNAQLSVDGSLLFVKEKKHFSIYDVSTVKKPELLSRVQKHFNALYPLSDGKHLILNYHMDFTVYDIKDPSAPRERFKVSPHLGYPKAIGKDGTFYLKNGDDLVLASILPQAKKIGVLKGGFKSATVQYFSEDNKTVYISKLNRDIQVVDVTSHKNPKITAQYSAPNYVGAVVPARDKKIIYAGLLGSIIVIDPAKAIVTSESLTSAHAEALRQYRRNDLEYDYRRVDNAINVLEAAGIRMAIKNRPPGLSDKMFASILNDYGFFLEKDYQKDKAIEIYKKVITLDPTRTVAYLNLGDALRKQLSKTDSFQEKISSTEEIRDAYLRYKELNGNASPEIDSFLALNIIDTPIDDFCEYVATYTSQGRLDELFGTGKTIERGDDQGAMRVEISYRGTAHRPYMEGFFDNETNKQIIDEKIPCDDSNGRSSRINRIGIVPFFDGHYLLYYDNGGYLVKSAPIGSAQKTGQCCKFEMHVVESFDEKEEDTELCHLVQFSNHPSYITSDEPTNLNYEVLKAAGYRWTHASGSCVVDFDNDGMLETLVKLRYSSTAGAGCGYNFFDLLNDEKDGFSTSKSRALLLEMQGIDDSFHPVPYCHGNVTGWFIYKGITYFETKYPKNQPESSQQEFHTVSYIKNGQIEKVCEADFKIQVEVQQDVSEAEQTTKELVEVK